MTNEQFESLWQDAEAASRGRMMARGYAAWRRRRQRTLSIAAVCLLTIAVATVPLLPSHSKEYEHVYCNRKGTSDAQWAALASEMLLES